MKLIGEGHDFIVVLHKADLLIGRTTQVQDANAWSERDFGRPFRDAKTGMLPPKLARMMVNLAVGSKPKKGAKLLDPFCGSGTILMETAMRYPAIHRIGSDIDGKQVRGAERNFQWLRKRKLVTSQTQTKWITASAQDVHTLLDQKIDYIVTEGFLGRPLQGNETIQELERNMHEVQTIWNETLPTLGPIQEKDGTLVCVWPEYIVGNEIVSLDVAKAIKTAGYTRKDKNNLLYGREHQYVHRRIVIMTKQRSE